MPELPARVLIRYGDDVTRALPLDQARLESFAGSVPWRRFRSRKGQLHLSGRYWSSTMAGHVVYESRLELARLLLADFDRDVSGIWAQPFRLEATVGGAAHGHVPDFLLVSTVGVVAVINVALPA
ncbi:MAG: TnsA-like heteromeric transposase endonuclease subunit [Natronosporangium sp.]